ncbi:hypothetical protein JCM11491_003552 [Sporobolomyces phaffii]
MGKLVGKLWVGGTLTLISFIGFTSQLFVILPSYPRGFHDRELVKLLVPFNGLLFLLYTNYFLTVRTNPGKVPPGWEPDWQGIESGKLEVKKLTGLARFCRTCQAYKPPRAHHCRQCKTCVLKMDHHCPWVNNCVGHDNHGHFVRFLFYVDLACSYHLWMITKRAFGITPFQQAPSTSQIVLLILNYTACVPVLLIVGVFSLFHFWSCVTNSTTIEGWEKDKVASLKRRGKIRQYRYPYHLGYFENVKDVLGPNPFLWWCPQKAPGDGLTYQVGTGIESHEQYLWPPRDEFVKPRSRRSNQPPRPAGSPFTYGTGLNPALIRGGREAPTTETSVGDKATLRQRPHPRQRAPALSRTTSTSSDGSTSSSSPSIVLSDYDDDPQPIARVDQDDEGLDDRDPDDVPLGTLAARRRHDVSTVAEGGETESETDEEDLDPHRAVRIRRGSEGYEIRPRFFEASPPPPPPMRPGGDESSNEDDDEWERIEGDPYERASEGELDDEGNRVRSGARYKYYVREEDSESDTGDEVDLGIDVARREGNPTVGPD